MRWPVKPNTPHPKTVWHQWFAWFPVRVDGEAVFMETIWRKGTRHVSYDPAYGDTIVSWTFEYANHPPVVPIQ